MQTPGRGNPTARRGAISCIVTLLLLFLLASADARTRQHRKPNPVTIALQPFLLARSVVHTVADPIVFNAPRAVATLATAPIRVAYRRVRDNSNNALRGEMVDEDEPANAAPQPFVSREAPATEPVNYDQPVRVAYMVQRPQEPGAPSAEQVEGDDQDLDHEPEREIASPETISRGDRPMVAGSRAILRGGIAYAPAHAPQSVKDAIWAANTLRRKPYVWGGGHGSFYDRGYDCSGTVSFALHGAGAIASPLPSSDLMRYGDHGRGRWFTIYARPGHTFAVIAGLRLDTTDFQDGGTTGPRWHTDLRDTRGYVARHPAGM